ncbi:MAG: sel1 repeat family protein [Bacteroidaceae bacterium]|nr:sel1 repeat family protein [Bacteroidaceae bacterium]
MTKHIEKGTNYAYTIERIKRINFRSLRSLSANFAHSLPSELSNKLYEEIQHGVSKLQSEPELNMYIYAFGLMHEAKLQYAFEHLPRTFTDSPTIDIIDYGCGQALGTICYADFLRKTGKEQTVRKVTLIEPSERALMRAALHVSCFLTDAEITTHLKGFDDLETADLIIDKDIPTLHIFSNVIDLADDYFNLEEFAALINGCSVGENHYICIEPYFNYNTQDEKLSRFIDLLEPNTYYEKTFSKGEFVDGKDWTCRVIMCKSLKEDEKRQEDKDSQCKNGDYCKIDSGVDNVDIIKQGEELTLLKCHEYDINWFIEAANNGYPKAQNMLGDCYYWGLGCESNKNKAFEWYQLAAENGEVNAQYSLGKYYENNIKGSYEQCLKWYCQVANFYKLDNISYDICEENIPDIFIKIVESGCAKAQYDFAKQLLELVRGTGLSSVKSRIAEWLMNEHTNLHHLSLAEIQLKIGDRYYYGDILEMRDVPTYKYLKKDYNLAFKLYYEAAKQNLPEGLYKLGLCYENGYGVKKDTSKALEYFIKSAENGYSYAQYRLGTYYENDNGKTTDYCKAISWYTKAAENNLGCAQYKLAVCYEKGKGVQQNTEEAFKWYLKAAEHNYTDAQKKLHEYNYRTQDTLSMFTKFANQGYSVAQFHLGSCFENGLGIEKKYIEAVKWYYLAFKHGNNEAKERLSNLNDDNILIKVTIEWFLRAAEQGLACAQYELGELYFNSYSVEGDYNEATKWYRRAAEQWHVNAQFMLGVCYDQGNGVEQSFTEAARWYRKAAEKGNVKAQYNLGYCYENGKGVEQSYTEAVKWYKKAAGNRYTDAQYNLGCCYENGNGVEQSYTEAIKWYRKAAENGNREAMYNLATCYRYGRGVKRSYNEAVKWYNKSSTEKALSALREIYDRNSVFKTFIKKISFYLE